jgi:thioredoxin reductase (NADPH)
LLRQPRRVSRATMADMPGENEGGTLASRFQQMFPVLSPAELDRVRRFGDVRQFPAGELLFQAGEAVPGMYVILSAGSPSRHATGCGKQCRCRRSPS